MKKIILLLGLVVTVSVNAMNPVYRCRFQPAATHCWAGGSYWIGELEFFTTPPNVYTIPDQSVTSLFLQTTGEFGTCCVTPAKPIPMGHTWEEISMDGGITWSYLAPTYVDVIMPLGSVSAVFYVQNSVLSSGLGLSYCP